MELAADVVRSCVDAVIEGSDVGGVIVPEESFGEGFWAACKRLERSFYVGEDTIEAARFYDKTVFYEVGGFSEDVTGGEDWDLSRRVRAVATIVRASAYIRHNEGRLYFSRTLRKMYYYGQHAVEYFARNPTNSVLADQSGPLARYKLFFSRPTKLLRNPLIGLGMLILKTAEYSSGGLGYWRAKRAVDRRS
jgi:GT2 family glycosyltransferase